MVIQFVCFELKLDNPIKVAYSCVSLYILGLKSLILVGVSNKINIGLYVVVLSLMNFQCFVIAVNTIVIDSYTKND